MAEDKKIEEQPKNEASKVETESSPERLKDKKPASSPSAEATRDTSAGKKVGKRKSEYQELKLEEIKPGMIVRVHQKIVDTNPKGEEKERVQIFQGMVLARKHGNEAGATITVRKVSEGVGVEKIFPLNMPSLTKFELVRKYKVKQAKPYYLRAYKKKLREIK